MRRYMLYLTEDEISDFRRSLSFVLNLRDIPVSTQQSITTFLVYLENLIP